ncbi:MAG: site-2 protease family protein [Eubacteriales bacterium]|nr:site-2 protease family protein [Eubacteriales bacterium]MDD3502575.1 site-2 protease family protein [Eubacteriales bacterium]MDD4681697.1 site-2 protease family protein [Eubacteriales bacterium]
MRLNFNWSRVALLSVPYTGMSLQTNGFDIMYNVVFILMSVLVLMISLSFHERSHAWSAYKLGDDTAALQGRLSMNPLRHLDPIGSLVFLVTSVMSGGRGIGWAKPVQINPARFSRSKTIKQGIMITSLAGPMSNVVLSFLSLGLLYIVFILYELIGVQYNLVALMLPLFCYMMFFANASLAIFNLLPIPPLDGYKIFGSMLPDKIYYKIMGYERYIGMVFLMLVLFGRGVLSRVLSFLLFPFNFLFFYLLGDFEWFKVLLILFSA